MLPSAATETMKNPNENAVAPPYGDKVAMISRKEAESIKIEDLGLSNRALGALKRGQWSDYSPDETIEGLGFRSLADLILASYYGDVNVNGAGRKTQAEYSDTLRRYGVSMNWGDRDNKRVGYADLFRSGWVPDRRKGGDRRR